ncbi:hypothetical protein OT109_18600 [Phycisphaeraceae bacterium D3-23]
MTKHSARRLTTRRLLAAVMLVPGGAVLPSQAEVTTTGSVSPNPLWSTAQDDLTVSSTGQVLGSMNIFNGGFVVSRDGTVRDRDTAVSVTGAGSQWLMFGDLLVGFSGGGSLFVQDGGAVTNQDAVITGVSTGDIGQVSIDGAGSNWTTHGDLFIGAESVNDSRSGIVSLTNGAVANVDGLTFIGNDPNNSSQLDFNNATLNTHAGIAPLGALRGTGTINADYWLLHGDHSIMAAVDLPTTLAFDQRPGLDISVNLAWTQPLDQLDFFGTDFGNLTLGGGLDVASTDGFVGYSMGTPGAVMALEGAGTSWTIARELHIGNLQHGELHITQGASVVLDGSLVDHFHGIRVGFGAGGDGRLVVDGAGSVFDAAGSGLDMLLGNTAGNGLGRMEVMAGGDIRLVELDLLNGSMLVDGVGSSLSTAALEVRPHAAATPDQPPQVVFSNGATVTSTSGTITGIGNDYVRAVVDGDGSRWAIGSFLHVGSNQGTGHLEVTGGAVLTSGVGRLGHDWQGAGTTTVTISGGGSAWHIANDLDLGDNANAVLNIADGGVVTVGGTLTVNRIAGSSALSYVELDNGTLTIDEGFLTAMTVLGTGTVNTNTWLLEGIHTVAQVADLPTMMQASHLSAQDLTINARWDIGPGNTFESFGVDGGDITMSGGFQVFSFDGYVGYTTGASGQLTLTGSDTEWQSSGLHVGWFGEGTLRIEDGAEAIYSHHSDLGRVAGAVGNIVVTGVGSELTGTGNFELNIGLEGTGSVRLENGASASTRTVWLGREDGGLGQITVTGAGSVWSSTSPLHIGSLDATGKGIVHITDGGQAFFAYTTLGHSEPNSGTLTIDGPGSRMVSDGGFDTGQADSARLTITDGGELIVDGISHFNGIAMVDGTGARWEVTDELFLGDGYAASLAVTNGAAVVTGDAFVGYNPSSTGSDADGDVLVDGAGSTWTANGSVMLGGDRFDRGNETPGTLTVSDGGAVNVTGALFVDRSTAGSFVHLDSGTLNVGSVLALNPQVTGTGTINADYWLIHGNHTISDFSPLPTQLLLDQEPGQNITVNIAWSDPSRHFEFFGVDDGNVVMNGGLAISSDTGHLGFNSSASGDLTLDGVATRWDIDDEFYVGHYGDGTLHVQNEAALTADETFIAHQPGTSGLIQINGVGSTVATDDLYIGYGGDGELRIEAGGSYTPANSGMSVQIAEEAGSTGHLLVRDPGSELEVGFNLFVGNFGEGQLTIESGGHVTSNAAYIAYWPNSTGIVTVDGAGSFWEADSTVRVGHQGDGQLVITDGGHVTAITLSIGVAIPGAPPITTRSSGLTHVTGPGSRLDVASNLQVGALTDGVLLIEDGALLVGRNGFIAAGSTSTGIATVRGTGSAWQMTEDLTVGNQSPDAILVIEDGGLVTNLDATLRGEAILRGAGSAWNSAGHVTVKDGGRLRIEDGAAVDIGGVLTVEVGGVDHLRPGCRRTDTDVDREQRRPVGLARYRTRPRRRGRVR